jgi:hypothetical protein
MHAYVLAQESCRSRSSNTNQKVLRVPQVLHVCVCVCVYANVNVSTHLNTSDTAHAYISQKKLKNLIYTCVIVCLYVLLLYLQQIEKISNKAAATRADGEEQGREIRTRSVLMHMLLFACVVMRICIYIV